MRLSIAAMMTLFAVQADAQMLSADFEGGVPMGWSLVNSQGESTTFRSLVDGECGAITGMIGFTGSACVTEPALQPGSSSSLWTPSFVFTGAGPYQLRFDSILSIDPTVESVSVSLSNQSNGSAETYLVESDFQNTGVLQSFTIDLPASLEGSTAMIRFGANVSIVGGGSFGWRIDNVEVDGATGLRYCFGVGTMVACPCGNDANALGGCVNSAGSSASLFATGSARVSDDQLNFSLTGGVPGSFAILASADNQLPAASPGVGVAAFDGLRCIGGNLIRHGARSIDGSGFVINGWGSASGPSLIAQGGFVAGQSRQWQTFYRDDTTLGCQTGQNSSSAVEITFAP